MPAPVRLSAYIVFLVIANNAVAVPSPQSVGTDLTILTHDDLYGHSSPRQAAAIVLSAHLSNSKAQSACNALQETLWQPPHRSDLDFLRYLDYGKPSDEIGRYWVGKRSSSICSAITTRGEVEFVPCDTRLPALCSQSASISSLSSNDTSPRWQTSVHSGNSTISGYRDKLSFRFLGLKFASYPSRFTYSTYQPPRGNILALSYGPGCIQAGCSVPRCSEDCLYLNVWTPYLPAESSSKKKAVMLWIHGGGFATGFGSDTTFDGGNMAARGDVVVVTINYRLSTLGTFALDNSTLRGNYWLSDQIAALEWVHRHIQDFGGDKDRVTVFGQSAGAASVRALLASPLAKGKFSRAIMQSCPGGAGYAKTFSQYVKISETSKATKALLLEKNCTREIIAEQVACLRALDPARLVTGSVTSTPVVDGTYLTTDTLLLDGSGPSLDVAIMTGVMHDDGDPFSSFSKSTNASQTLIEQGYDATAILGSNQFPLPRTGNATLDIFNLTARVATDAEFRCLSQSTAFSAANNNVFPVLYSYEIDRSLQLVEWSPNPPTCEAPQTANYPLGDPGLPYFKCHSGELYYVFGTAIRQGRQPRDDHDIPFSQYLLDSWTAFGRTKDPNPALDFLHARGFTNTSATVRKTDRWRPITADSMKLRIFNVEPRDEDLREVGQCRILGFPLEYYSK